MKIKILDDQTSVSDQLFINDLPSLAAQNINCIICNRPDNEATEQDSFETIANAAKNLGIAAINIPFAGGAMTEADTQVFASALKEHSKVHAYCRTGNRSSNIWAAAKVCTGTPAATVLNLAKNAGYDVSNSLPACEGTSDHRDAIAKPLYDIVIVGAGSGGIATAASLLKRNSQYRIAIIDPSSEHYYQPGWTMVGGGIFDAATTRRNTRELIPKNVTWLQAKVSQFEPSQDCVILDNGKTIFYKHLVVCPGLTLNWDGIEGLSETLGKNGVTSNYRYDLAPYTWELVQNLKGGKAVFTQPPMPIKCAGAPQKALYLSGDYWYKSGLINDINIEFYNAGGVLFGVGAYVPALEKYIAKYQAKLHFTHTLIKIDGPNKTAWFSAKDTDGNDTTVSTNFDMIHVCPPQTSPDFIKNSALADAAGWLDVDQHSLQHKQYANIWGVGDVLNTTNAKTMAAARKQAPVVAQNISNALNQQALSASYDGYGSCPLTVERGKIVLAEFGYGGKLLPSFPNWIINGTQATRCAWILKSQILPQIYWHGMLKGREWMAKPNKL